jgi:hypothetical protein
LDNAQLELIMHQGGNGPVITADNSALCESRSDRKEERRRGAHLVEREQLRKKKNEKERQKGRPIFFLLTQTHLSDFRFSFFFPTFRETPHKTRMR